MFLIPKLVEKNPQARWVTCLAETALRSQCQAARSKPLFDLESAPWTTVSPQVSRSRLLQGELLVQGVDRHRPLLGGGPGVAPSNHPATAPTR